MNSSSKGAAMECMFLANDALTHYVAIHDRIFKSQATLLSVLRNLFGGGPDFAKLRDDAKAADDLWERVENHVEQCFTTCQSGHNPRERIFFDALIQYVKAVKRTTTHLLRRQQALFNKSQGHALTLSEHQRIEREYADAVQLYVRFGTSLQPLAEQLLTENA